jgi:hypothetical protein
MTHPSVAAHCAESDLRVGSIIGRSASVLLRHFLTFFIVMEIAYLPVTLARWAGWAGWSVSLKGALLVLLLLLATLGRAVVVHAAFQDMRRRPVRLVESLRVVLRLCLPIIGLTFVSTFLLLLESILLLSILGLILLIPGLILYTMWFVGLPACLVERLGPWTSLRRSRELSGGHRWSIFGLVLLVFFIPDNGSPIIAGFLFGLWGPTGSLIGNQIWSGIWGAIGGVVIAVTYHDLRVIKEGVAMEQIAAVFD